MRKAIIISGRKGILGESFREKFRDQRKLVYRGHLGKMWIIVRGELQCEQVGEGSSVNR